MSDYMDYPFLCDEKLGDRCKAQCSVCKAADTPARFKQPKREAVSSEELIARITAYLSEGGLFNPELANHDNVRDLLIDCRAALTGLQSREAVVRECAAVCDGEGILNWHECKAAILKLLEPK